MGAEQGRECLVEITVFESAGFGPETMQSPPRWQVGWGPLCNPGAFAGEAGVVNVYVAFSRLYLYRYVFTCCILLYPYHVLLFDAQSIERMHLKRWLSLCSFKK